MKSFLRLIFLTVQLLNLFHQLLGEHLKHSSYHKLSHGGTDSDDGESVLDKEVEDESDNTYEGQDRHSYILPSLGRVQLILSYIPNIMIILETSRITSMARSGC